MAGEGRVTNRGEECQSHRRVLGDFVKVLVALYLRPSHSNPNPSLISHANLLQLHVHRKLRYGSGTFGMMIEISKRDVSQRGEIQIVHAIRI